MIYADHNSTTPIDPAVREAMQPYLTEHWGNPSSAHSLGRRARQGVEKAREQVALLLQAQPEEIFFTGGATEANNWVIKGLLSGERPHLLTSRVEHPSILRSCQYLERRGWADVTYLPVDSQCLVDPATVFSSRHPHTRLLSLMLANNETGALQPVRELTAWARGHDILVHTDAAQAVGKIPVDVAQLGVDFLTVAGHKLYAPKGVGALFVRQGRQLEPLLHGPGQERGQRAGTESVPLIVGLGQACEICRLQLDHERAKLAQWRDQLWDGLRQQLNGQVQLNGPPGPHRLPNTLSLNFRGVSGSELLQGTPGLAASTGPACHDGQVRLSHVLEAMGVSPDWGRGTVRLSLGRWTHPEDIPQIIQSLTEAYERLTR